MSREVYTCLTKSSIIYVQRSPVYICLAESSLIKSLTGAHSCRLPHCALHSCCPSLATQSQPSEIHRHKQNREKIRTILPNPSPFSPGLTGVCLFIKVDVVRERDNQHKHLNKNPLQLPSYVIKLTLPALISHSQPAKKINWSSACCLHLLKQLMNPL